MQKGVNNFLKQFKHKDMFQVIEQAIKKMHWLQHVEGIIQMEEKEDEKMWW
jgi:hypothetical protein